jgi:hypothetical protein
VSKDKFAGKRLEQIGKDAGGSIIMNVFSVAHYRITLWNGWVKLQKISDWGPVRILDIPLTTAQQSSVKILYASLVTQQNGMSSHRNPLHKTCQHHEAPRCVACYFRNFFVPIKNKYILF